MDQKLIRSQSPHIHAKGSKQKVMLLVILALLPAAAAGMFHFGMSAGIIILVSLATGIIFDNILQRLTGNNQGLLNGSAVVTALLLALILPPTVPLWIPILGVCIAIGLGKYTFGIGNNIFNPALVGRAFLVVSWPKIMTTWVTPDGITAATPLALAKEGAFTQYTNLLIGNIGGSIGETSAIALIIGGLFLIIYRMIDWKIPLVYIGTVGILTLGSDSLFHILSGGLLIGAFFMATDYITIPITPRGRLIFALGCGILTVIFRLYSSMPEGVMYSILLMNAATPLIERFTIPRPFGHAK